MAEETSDNIIADSSTSFKIVLLGDLMIGRTFNIFGNHRVLRKCNVLKSCEAVKNVCGNLQHGGAVYVWGDILGSLLDSDVRIANLEGVFSSNSDEELLSSYVHKIHPWNLLFLKEAQLSCCALANNHILDCGFKPVRETIDLLNKEKIKWCGFGTIKNCWKPAILRSCLKKQEVNVSLCSISKSNKKSLGNDLQQRPLNLAENLLGDLPTVCSSSSQLQKSLSEKPSRNDCNVSHNISVQNKHPVKVAVFAMADHFREWAAEGKKAGINFFDISNFTYFSGNPNRCKWTSLEIIKDNIEKGIFIIYICV